MLLEFNEQTVADEARALEARYGNLEPMDVIGACHRSSVQRGNRRRFLVRRGVVGVAAHDRTDRSGDAGAISLKRASIFRQRCAIATSWSAISA